MRNTASLMVVAAIAALSSVLCAFAAIPVWIMFIGWIAFVAGGNRADTLGSTIACAILGTLLGAVGAMIIDHGTPSLGYVALLIGVFVIVLAALLAHHVPLIGNVICYFIGMTTYFASGLPSAWATWATLWPGLLLGIVSGFGASLLAGRIARPAAES